MTRIGGERFAFAAADTQTRRTRDRRSSSDAYNICEIHVIRGASIVTLPGNAPLSFCLLR